MASRASFRSAGKQQPLHPFRWRSLPPAFKQRVRAGYLVLIGLGLGIYICASNYGYWFGNKSQDGFKIDRAAAEVQMPSYEALPAPDGEGILYVPELEFIRFSPDQIEQSLEIGNHPESEYFLSYVIRVAGQDAAEQPADFTIYRSGLYAQGKGSQEVRLEYAFSPGSYPASIEYRYYRHQGMLHFVASETRDIHILAE